MTVWSDGIAIEGADGIDPDLAWGDDGTAYVTYSGHTRSASDRSRPVAVAGGDTRRPGVPSLPAALAGA